MSEMYLPYFGSYSPADAPLLPGPHNTSHDKIAHYPSTSASAGFVRTAGQVVTAAIRIRDPDHDSKNNWRPSYSRSHHIAP